MKNRNIHDRRTIPALLIALGLGCFSLSPAVKAADDRSIVGLWNVHYFQGTVEITQTFDQWHRDGLEFEINSIRPGAACQGIFEQTAIGTFKLFHVIWTFDATGALSGHIQEIQINTVGQDGNRYRGTFARKFFDTSGNLVHEDAGTVRATRLSVP